jgi:hypothetical protein
VLDIISRRKRRNVVSVKEDVASLRSIADELINIQALLENELIHYPAGTTYGVIDDALHHTTAAVELLYDEADALARWPEEGL